MSMTSYDPSLVALSIVIAVLASYTALDLGGRVRGGTPGQRWDGVGGASLAMFGGSPSVENAFGRGTAFTFVVPAALPSSPHPADAPAAPEQAAA